MVNVNVLIATVGRPSLGDLCDSILEDATSSGVEVTIYVALNGHLKADVNTNDSRVKLIHVSELPCGVGKATNEAMAMLPDGWTWVIADDDFWHTGKFTNDLEFLSHYSPSVRLLLLPSVEFWDNFSKRIRPQKPLKANGSVLKYLYGHPAFLRNTRYITLSGSVAQTFVWNSYPFGNGAVREDIDLLIEMQNGGVVLAHAPKVSVTIDARTVRGADRDPSGPALAWALSHLSGMQFTWFIGTRWPKPFVWDGKTAEIQEMISLVSLDRTYSRIRKYPSVLLLYAALGVALLRKPKSES